MPCPECGESAQVQVDDGLACTLCGTLASAVVLADGHASFHTQPRDRDKRSSLAMATFIHAVLSTLGSPGLAPRAQNLFTQAMARGNYRWGRRAKLTAGASVALALRETLRSDALHDIALLLDESTVSLSRAVRAVAALLDVSFASTDPAVHLPVLQSHLHAVESALPKSLLSVLAPLSLQTAVRTATSLSQIVAQHPPLVNLPTPPTACALLILGLEAEARAPLPHLGELTRSLAARFALSPGVVSSRYKTIYSLVEEQIRHVPWLDQFVHKGRSKRTIVAKGIKDVVQFQQEIRQTMTLGTGEEEDHPMEAAHRFLRDPLSCPAPSTDVLTHLLTCPSDRARGTAPTRLELLVAARGGSTAEEIADEELFVEGELEGLLRDERERDALGPLFQLEWGDEKSTEETADTEPKRGAKRVDMDALARILGGDVDQITTGGAELVSDWRPASPDQDDIFG